MEALVGTSRNQAVYTVFWQHARQQLPRPKSVKPRYCVGWNTSIVPVEWQPGRGESSKD